MLKQNSFEEFDKEQKLVKFGKDLPNQKIIL